MSTTTNAKADTSSTVYISAVSLRGNQPQPQLCDELLTNLPGDTLAMTARQRGRAHARALFDLMCGVPLLEQAKDRDGLTQLARTAQDGRIWWTPTGNMLKGIASSVLRSAYFQSDSAAKAWNRYVEQQAKFDAEHGADAEGPDATPNGLDLAAQRAMDQVVEAGIAVHFAAELAELVSICGDGKLIQVEYTPRAQADGTRTPAPKAAQTLRALMAKASAKPAA